MPNPQRPTNPLLTHVTCACGHRWDHRCKAVVGSKADKGETTARVPWCRRCHPERLKTCKQPTR